MKKPIYSGLSNEQAFALINARIGLQGELPRLSLWNAQQHWRNAFLIAAALTAVVIAVALACDASFVGVAASAAGAVACVVGFACIHAILTQRRLKYLFALKAGLDQFKSAEEHMPGASVSELLSMVSDKLVTVMYMKPSIS